MAASLAQVYSANVVGYINITCPPGFTLFANQLSPTNSTVGSLLPTPPDGVSILTWSGAGFSVDGYSEVFGWDDPSLQLNPGSGAFFNNTTTTNIVLTFVGDVLQGNRTNSIAAGLSIISSYVPQAMDVSTNGLVPSDGDSILTWNGGYIVNGYSEVFGWDNPPVVNVGQAFFYNATVPIKWIRNFVVN